MCNTKVQDVGLPISSLLNYSLFLGLNLIVSNMKLTAIGADYLAYRYQLSTGIYYAL